jgi:hypothetical protein
LGQFVTDTGNRGDRVRAKQLAQGADLDAQVPLFHREAAPNVFEQFLFGDNTICVIIQERQHVKSPSANLNRMPGKLKTTGVLVNFERLQDGPAHRYSCDCA